MIHDNEREQIEAKMAERQRRLDAAEILQWTHDRQVRRKAIRRHHTIGSKRSR